MTRATVLPLRLICALALLLALPAGLRSAEPGPNPDRQRPGPYRGLPLTLLRINKDSIVVRPRVSAPAAKEQEFKIDADLTKVFLQVVTDERTDDNGRLVRRTDARPGTLDDLEVGRDVYVASNKDGVATDIIVPPKPPAKDADAKEKKPGPKK